MDESIVTPQPEIRPGPAPWSDLFLYLFFGFGLFFAAGFGLRQLLTPGSILSSALIYALNVLFFVGAVYVVGVRRGRLSWASLGLSPARWEPRWLTLAVLVVVFFNPIRVLVAAGIQLILEGNLNSLVNSARVQIFTPSGNIWVNFLVTLVLAGMAAPLAEELFFRGALYTWFRSRFSATWAILASSVLFALGHYDTLAVVVTSFILGAVNAWLFERYRSIWLPIAVHAVNNSLAVVLLYATLLAGVK